MQISLSINSICLEACGEIDEIVAERERERERGKRWWSVSYIHIISMNWDIYIVPQLNISAQGEVQQRSVFFFY